MGGHAQYPGQALVTRALINPPIKRIVAQTSGSDTRDQTPETRGTIIVQPAERRPQTP